MFALYIQVDGKWCLAGRRHGLWSAFKYWLKGYKVVKDAGKGIEMPMTL
jgi:hypothetical protein